MDARRIPISWTAPLSVTLLLFPAVTITLVAAGFLFGVPVGHWQGILGVGASLGTCFIGGATGKQKVKNAGLTAFVIVLCVATAGLSMMYSIADGAAYHRAASMLMTHGWNPVFDSTADALNTYFRPDAIFRTWHVAYLPRASWMFGAVLYKMTGFVESADTLNILSLCVSYLVLAQFVDQMFGFRNWKKALSATLLAFSPTVVTGIFGGACDSIYYSLFLVSLASATIYLETNRKQWLVLIALSLAIIANIKFTGVIATLLVIVTFVCPLLVGWWRNRYEMSTLRNWLIMSLACCCLAGIIGFSPYITNWVNHGGPFYPKQSFDKRVVLDDQISYDFDYMNEDARIMGFWGRLCYAYVSKNLSYAYYRYTYDRPQFDPEFKIIGGVEGLGPVFRFAFVMSLILLPFVKLLNIRWLLWVLLISVLMQPTYYTGYVRYVPQFYAFPMIVIFAFVQSISVPGRFGQATLKIAGWAVPGYYALMLLAHVHPLSNFALQWITSVQNQQILEAMRKDPHPHVWAETYYAVNSITFDYGCSPIIRCEKGGDINVSDSMRSYGPHSGGYIYFTQNRINNFMVYQNQPKRVEIAVDVGKDKNAEFFLRQFLPQQVRGGGLRYIWGVMKIRAWELAHAWGKCQNRSVN